MNGTDQTLTTPTHGSAYLFARAAQDWTKAIRMWRLWTALGMEDLSDRYRRTLLGISWVVASFGIFVFVKIMVFGQMTTAPIGEFALFVTLGFGLWSFISTMVLDSCVAYTASGNWLLGTAVPYPVFFLQIIFRNWLVFALTLIVMAAVVVWQKHTWSPVMLSALAGLLVYVVTPAWLIAILAPLCARYRDMWHTMQTVMRLLFFVTPIIWMPSQSGNLAVIAKYNVITHFIEIVREPLIYETIPYTSWAVVLIVNVIGISIGFASYALTRHKIAFWL